MQQLVENYFNLAILSRSFPELLRGFGVTVQVAIATIVLGVGLGLVLAVTRAFAIKPGHGSGPTTGTDWSFGINTTSANPMTDASLLAEIGRKLRRYYQALTEEALPEHFLEIVDRFPTDPHKTRGDGR